MKRDPDDVDDVAAAVSIEFVVQAVDVRIREG